MKETDFISKEEFIKIFADSIYYSKSESIQEKNKKNQTFFSENENNYKNSELNHNDYYFYYNNFLELDEKEFQKLKNSLLESSSSFLEEEEKKEINSTTKPVINNKKEIFAFYEDLKKIFYKYKINLENNQELIDLISKILEIVKKEIK